jgi:hypothetical protein
MGRSSVDATKAWRIRAVRAAREDLLDRLGGTFFFDGADFLAGVTLLAAGSDCGGVVAVLCAAMGDTAIETESAAASHLSGSGVEFEGLRTFICPL